MAGVLPIPQIDGLNTDKGQSTPQNYKFLQSLEAAARAVAASITGLKTSLATETVSVLVLSPANQDYLIWVNVPFEITVLSLTTISSSGTCTLVAKNNTTAIGGLSNSVSSSEVTNAASSGNVIAVGDDLRLTVSANAACKDMAVTIKYSRVL